MKKKEKKEKKKESGTKLMNFHPVIDWRIGKITLTTQKAKLTLSVLAQTDQVPKFIQKGLK